MKTMLSILALLAVCGPARAGLLWTWTNAETGLEQGTFITDGEFENDSAAVITPVTAVTDNEFGSFGAVKNLFR